MTDAAKASWTKQERDTIDAMLDVMVPASADGKLPAGSTLGVRDYLWARREDTHGVAVAVDAVVARAMEFIGEAGVESLHDVPQGERVAFVQRVEAAAPLDFIKFTNNAYLGYYTHPSVPPHHGMPDRPPQPLGHQVDADEDLDALLAPVRERGKMYIDA